MALVAFTLSLTQWAFHAASLERTNIPTSFESYYLPSARVLHYLSLGHDAAMADLIWAKSLVYFGEEFTGMKRQTWLRQYLDTITDLDPYFRDAYLWAGTAMMYGGQHIDEKAVRNAIHFYRKGLRVFPEDWQLAWYLGFTLYFELPTRLNDEKRAARAKKEAMRWLVKVGRNPQAPAFFRSFVLGALDKEGLREMASRMAAQIYAVTDNPEDLAALRKHLDSILGRKKASQWESWRREPLQQWQERLPWVPFELFLLMRDPAPLEVRRGAAEVMKSLVHDTGTAEEHDRAGERNTRHDTISPE